MLQSMNTYRQMKNCDMETCAASHLAYQPLLPTANKYLQQKWDKASYDLHREKVTSTKTTINTKPPKNYVHLSVKLKKLKLEEERKAKIDRENSMLKEKISSIMRTTGGVNSRKFYDKKSLGKEKRQVELLHITKENQMILCRLSQCKPHYNVRKWHEDWLKTLMVMDSIARYPRGRANQQKRQEQPIKKGGDCDKGQKGTAEETTHSHTSRKPSGNDENEEEGLDPAKADMK
ncbi:sperm axonemal maintenance protein CFAP97D1 isoform X2 [Antennarius striatus]|uniref:sperm axonemal maintenance protein CFAP97D1 isoform X2 n=1 Tax=Antennarius striatus TaxID=241820 RepID=UPI0035B1845A